MTLKGPGFTYKAKTNIKFGDGYLAISQAFSPNMPGLDHYPRFGGNRSFGTGGRSQVRRFLQRLHG
jgi:hypothetical protein